MSALRAEPTATRRRIALYSHDTQGLGHVRRNIEVARALLAERPDTDVLLLTCAPEAAGLPRPEQADLVVLPSVSKSRSGAYAASSPGLELDDVLHVRGALVASAIESFRPDVLVVDKEARGLRGELDPALAVARRTVGVGGRRTRLVLGLRDVLDAPLIARREWESAGTTHTLLSSYDAVWVYGDPRVHDLAEACGLPVDVRRMMHFTGYLADGRHRADPGAAPCPRPPYVLCLVGGGQDGVGLARAFARASYPAGHQGVVVTGPYLPPEARGELDRLAEDRDDLAVLGFVDDAPDLIDAAAAVVSMGGYNSVCELLASGRPGLVVPRVAPRREQAVRADELARHTHLDTLHPDAADAAALGEWLAGAVHRVARPHELDLAGLSRLPFLLDRLLEEIDHVPA